MPNRIIREGILTSERVNALDYAGEVFYRRLLSVVDDYGRFDAHLAILRARCYPLRLDAVKERAIADWLTACADANLLTVYEVDGKPYVQVHNFKQQRRAAVSKYPAPDGVCIADAKQMHSTCVADAKQMHSTCVADAKQMIASAHLVGGVVGGVGEDVVVEEKAATVKPARPASRNLADAEWLESLKPDARAQGIDVDAEAIKARRWLSQKPGKPFTRRFFVNWLNRCDKVIRHDPRAAARQDADAAKARAVAEIRERLPLEATDGEEYADTAQRLRLSDKYKGVLMSHEINKLAWEMDRARKVTA